MTAEQASELLAARHREPASAFSRRQRLIKSSIKVERRPTAGREEPFAHLASLNMVKAALRICHAARQARIRDGPEVLREGPLVRTCLIPPESRAALSDDFKLFATTFIAGFLFVSILIGVKRRSALSRTPGEASSRARQR